jgi:GntP family gluconate:H+ symporter
LSSSAACWPCGCTRSWHSSSEQLVVAVLTPSHLHPPTRTTRPRQAVPLGGRRPGRRHRHAPNRKAEATRRLVGGRVADGGRRRSKAGRNLRVDSVSERKIREKTERTVIARGTAQDLTVVPGDFVVDPPQADAAARAAAAGLGDRVAEGFGRTVTNIGILIALASIVGECLLLSGGAEKIVAWSRRAAGERRVSLAFLASGFVLGIPVFFDTVFYLLVPLGKVMRVRTGRDYTLYILCIVAGATMTHSLVPPTRGRCSWPRRCGSTWRP